jgi:PknH-like protein
MPASLRRSLVAVCAAALTAACTSTVTGSATRSALGPDEHSRSPVDVDGVLLEQSRLQEITGAGDALTVIPSMDGKSPVDIDVFARRVPQQCSWIFAETQTFGSEIEEFHKTTYQDPPHSALISQGAAAYHDVATARGAFEVLAGRVAECATSTSGYVRDWTTAAEAIHVGTGSACGRDYRLKSIVLVEVTSCGYPRSVSDAVMTDVLARIPG